MRSCPGLFVLLFAACCSCGAWAQETTALARELVQVKGGYAAKKRLLEEMRLRAYVPLMLKAVGTGPGWNPSHPNWRLVEARITEDWFRLNADHARGLGRDPTYDWFDETLAREYAKAFTAQQLAELMSFHRTPAARSLLELEKELLTFYPASMVRALAAAMIASEPLSGREQDLFKSPESRVRRDFVALFESEAIMRQESVRVGGAYVEASYPTVQQGALAIAADRIDALRARLAPDALQAITAFVQGEAGRRERAFLARVVPVVLPAPEDPALSAKLETDFFAQLENLTAQWRKLAAATRSVLP